MVVLSRTGAVPDHVTVFAPLGLQTFDEYILWGLLGATLDRRTDASTLLATPYWM
ncbi:MAG TPA: hypothetical protein PKD54_11210 [Pirellulaceae bacterium]|nr:hypothetical protein [Pirellulaceae bacterium]